MSDGVFDSVLAVRLSKEPALDVDAVDCLWDSNSRTCDSDGRPVEDLKFISSPSRCNRPQTLNPKNPEKKT